MAYGFKATGGMNGDIIIADSGYDGSHFIPIEVGTGSITTTMVNPRTDLVFFRYNVPAASGSYWVAPTLYNGSAKAVSSNVPANVRFVSTYSRSGLVISPVDVTVDYMVFRPSRFAMESLGGWGLLIKNAQGNVQFDTGRFSLLTNIRLDTRFNRSNFGLVIPSVGGSRDFGPFSNTHNVGGLSDWYCINQLNIPPADATSTTQTVVSSFNCMNYRRGTVGGLAEGVYTANFGQLVLANGTVNYRNGTADPGFALFEGERLI